MFKLTIINKIQVKILIYCSLKSQTIRKLDIKTLERMRVGRKPHALLVGVQTGVFALEGNKVVIIGQTIHTRVNQEVFIKDFFPSLENIFSLLSERREDGERAGCGGEKETDRQTDMDAGEKQSVGSHTCPDQGSKPQLGMCPALESNLQTFGLWDKPPTN